MSKVVGKADVMRRFDEIKKAYLRKELEKVCEALLFDMYEQREFQGFTGNTQTSFTIGLYLDGSLVYVLALGDSLAEPIRLKIPKGKKVFLENPYEGESRSVLGQVDVDDKYGQYSAIEFLKRYKADKKGFSIVATTGTEYSVFIEKTMGLNVMTDTYNAAKQILLWNLKPIK